MKIPSRGTALGFGSVPAPPVTRSSRKRHLPRLLLLVLATTLFLQAPASASSVVSFVHVSGTENLFEPFSGQSWTVMDHPQLNDNPYARVLVSHARNDAVPYGFDNDRVIAPRYDHLSEGGRWGIFNANGSDMDLNVAFHVVVLGPGTASFLHLTHEGNISGVASEIACPVIYDCSGFADGGEMLGFNVRDAWELEGAVFDVAYSIREAELGSLVPLVRAESGLLPDMKPGALFWILIGEQQNGGELSFSHTATAGNIVDTATRLDHPLLNGRAAVRPIVSKRLVSGSPLPEVVGLYFFPDDERWYIYHQDRSAMTEGEEFTIYVPPLFSDGFESGSTDWWD